MIFGAGKLKAEYLSAMFPESLTPVFFAYPTAVFATPPQKAKKVWVSGKIMRANCPFIWFFRSLEYSPQTLRRGILLPTLKTDTCMQTIALIFAY